MRKTYLKTNPIFFWASAVEASITTINVIKRGLNSMFLLFDEQFVSTREDRHQKIKKLIK